MKDNKKEGILKIPSFLLKTIDKEKNLCYPVVEKDELHPGHGNVTNLTDSSGAIVKTYSYDAFGVEQNPSDSDTNPFRYCGEYYDSEIEQIYLRARYYDPSLGRFTQQDPAMEDGYNWYIYCKNNPIIYIDPSGLISFIFCAEDDKSVAQAEVRRKAYENFYGTPCIVYTVNSAEELVEKWNGTFGSAYKGETIDAVEIISHGSAAESRQSDGRATGYLYFTNDKVNKLYARPDGEMGSGDYSMNDLCYVEAKGLNINACNGANPDLYSVASGFFRNGKFDYITGWDGGVDWDWSQNKAVRGGGDYTAWMIWDPWSPVKEHQSTYWNNVEKDANGAPVRPRVGKRVFARNWDGTYVQIE